MAHQSAKNNEIQSNRRYANIRELIEDAFLRYADKPAYTCFGHTLSYRELDQRSQIFADYLRNELGLCEGDRLGIQLPNILQFPIALYGAIRAGLIVVNINPLYTPRELEHQLVDSGTKALVVLANFARSASECLPRSSVEHLILTEVGDELPLAKRILINFFVKHIKNQVPNLSLPGAHHYRAIMRTEAKGFDLTPVNADDVLVLQYTGGTTGLSKGAMLTHHNLASNVWQMTSHTPAAFVEGEEVFVACLPMYHIYALNLHALSGFSAGCHNVLIPNPRDLKSISTALKKNPCSVFLGINTLFRALARDKQFQQLDFSKLKVTAAGGMSLTKDAAVAWKEVTGCTISEGYGLTETSPVLTGNIHGRERIGFIGVPLPETEISLRNDQGEPVADGEAGELCARGPQVMLGYWNRPDETAAVMTSDGFFKTGDIARRDLDGHLKIVDRKKDMILVSGFNVYPNEIEEVLCQNPKIMESAAVGVASAESGEVVKVFVVREDESLTAEDVIAYCRIHLTGYKIPKYVEFRSELPKSNVGKILRRELRD